MFGVLLISVCTFMHVYVFWRIASVPFIKYHVPFKIFIGTAVISWLLPVASRVFQHSISGPFAEILEFVGMNWLGILFIIFFLMLATDLVTLWGLFCPRISAILRGYVLLAGIILSIFAIVQGLSTPVVENYEATLPGLPKNLDGIVIVALSDMHISSSQPGKYWLEKVLAQVKTLSPDLVVLLGDIFERSDAVKAEFTEPFKKLSPPLGLWAVPGNHEYYGGNTIQRMDQENIPLLINRWVQIRPGLTLAGVEDLTIARRRYPWKDPIALSLEGRPPQGAVILLSHSPLQMEKAAQKGINLMLSGHTHAGQIWPFGFLVKLQYPLLEGLYKINDMTMIISRGTGTWGPRMRLWKKGQILCITLKAQEQ